MIEGFDLNHLGTAIPAIAAGAIGVVIGLRKLYSMWTSDGVEVSRNTSQKDVIDMLSEQATSFAASNKLLQEEVAQLKRSNLDLILETTELKHSLNQMKSENDALRIQIDQLMEKMTALSGQLTAAARP